MTHEVFISYSRKDQEAVLAFVGQLQAAGFSVWIDQRDIDGALLWGEEIVAAIEKCMVLVLFLSNSSVGSENVVREIALAFEQKKPILPLLLEPVPIPRKMKYQLAGINYLEVFKFARGAAIDAVVRTLENLGVPRTTEHPDAPTPKVSPTSAPPPPPPEATPPPTPPRQRWKRRGLVGFGVLFLLVAIGGAYLFWPQVKPHSPPPPPPVDERARPKPLPAPDPVAEPPPDARRQPPTESTRFTPEPPSADCERPAQRYSKQIEKTPLAIATLKDSLRPLAEHALDDAGFQRRCPKAVGRLYRFYSASLLLAANGQIDQLRQAVVWLRRSGELFSDWKDHEALDEATVYARSLLDGTSSSIDVKTLLHSALRIGMVEASEGAVARATKEAYDLVEKLVKGKEPPAANPTPE